MSRWNEMRYGLTFYGKMTVTTFSSLRVSAIFHFRQYADAIGAQNEKLHFFGTLNTSVALIPTLEGKQKNTCRLIFNVLSLCLNGFSRKHPELPQWPRKNHDFSLFSIYKLILLTFPTFEVPTFFILNVQDFIIWLFLKKLRSYHVPFSQKWNKRITLFFTAKKYFSLFSTYQ